MTASVAELLNTIRTSALKGQGNRELLSIADTLEAVLDQQDDALGQTHEALARAQSELSHEKSEFRILLSKYLALEEWRRIVLSQRFGRSSERWVADELTQALLFNEIEANLEPLPPPPSTDATAGEDPPQATKRTNPTPRGKREGLPENLPRVDVHLGIPESERACCECGKVMVEIGQDVSEQLQVRPAEFFVERTIRPIYVCTCGCGGTTTAPVPRQVYPKSKLGDSVITQIVVAKFCDALPFYRQERILGRVGIDLSRQTMARAAQALADWLEPLDELLSQRIAACNVLCADETRLRVLQENGIKKRFQFLYVDCCGARYGW